MARKTVTVLPPRVKAREQALTAGQGVTWWEDWERAEPQPLDFRRAAREGVRQNAVVFACLRTLANAYAEPKVEVQDKSGKALPDHPLALLLDQPNPHMDRARFRKFCVIYQAIGGNCYIWLERDNAGEVIGMWPMHDGQCEPVRGTGTDRDTSWVSHYLYKVGDSAYRIPASDVIQLMWFINAEDPTRGMSALAPIALALDTMRELNVYVYALLKNDATPKTIVTYRGPLTEDAIKRFKSEFADSFGGTKRGTVAVMSEADGISVNRLSANLADLAADSLRDSTEADICMQFGINPVLVGARVGIMRSIQGAPREMRENFAETTLSPLWEEEESAFSHRLLRDNWQDDYKRGVRVKLLVEGVRALQEDADARATRFEKAWKNGGVRRKYYWRALNFTPPPDEEEDGEAYFYEVMMPKRGETPPQLQGNQPRLPGQPGAPQLPAPGQTGQEGEPLEGEPAPGEDVPPQLKTLARLVAGLLARPTPPVVLERPVEARVKASATDLAAGLEDEFAAALERVFKRQLRRVLDDLDAQPDGVAAKAVTAGAMAALERLYGAGDGGWFGNDEDELNKDMARVVEKYTKEASDDIANRYAAGGNDEELDARMRVVRIEAAGWARKYSGKLIKDINATSRDEVRKALQAAIERGESVDELTARLKNTFGGRRARVIAATETTKALARATVRVGLATGSGRFVYHAELNADEACLQYNGKEYAASTATKLIPVHPNCRCSLEPVAPVRALPAESQDVEGDTPNRPREGEEAYEYYGEDVYKEIPELGVFGDKLRVRMYGEPTDRELFDMQSALSGLQKLPVELARKMVPLLDGIHIGNRAVPFLDDAGFLDAGGLYSGGDVKDRSGDTVAGVYFYRTIIVGHIPGYQGAGVYGWQTMLHEFGHAVGNLLHYQENPAFIQLHVKLYNEGKLSPYFQGESAGSFIGVAETFAEAFANYYGVSVPAWRDPMFKEVYEYFNTILPDAKTAQRLHQLTSS